MGEQKVEAVQGTQDGRDRKGEIVEPHGEGWREPTCLCDLQDFLFASTPSPCERVSVLFRSLDCNEGLALTNLGRQAGMGKKLIIFQ